MDPESFTAIILALIVIGLPVTLGVGSSMLKGWMKHRETMAGALNAQAAEKAAQYAAQADRLEQRVRVIERIVTETPGKGGLGLSDEIEKLRLAPPPLN